MGIVLLHPNSYEQFVIYYIQSLATMVLLPSSTASRYSVAVRPSAAPLLDHHSRAYYTNADCYSCFYHRKATHSHLLNLDIPSPALGHLQEVTLLQIVQWATVFVLSLNYLLSILNVSLTL